MAKTKIDDNLHWYKDAVIYELHIKAFRDSNGDGIGDFGGLLEKLDYLQELGVTAIWVLPFYPSPLKDDGYDIADYYAINPRYGNLEQFRQFLDEAHNRGLKVITELVINHTSDQHPWFQRARTAPKGSPERNYYVWTDNPNDYKDVRIIFQDFEASNWTWDPIAQQYYWHRFFHHQPDLNYDNLAVQEEIFKIIDYWCAMGVDGFRLDAVPYLYEREGTNGENLPETHAFLKKLRKHIDNHFPSTVFLAEANMWPEDSASYFGDGDECHMNYHFPVMPRMFMSLQQEDRYPITDIFDQTPEIPETCQWAMFLRNHDELTLEMVTDEERDFMYKAYAKDPKAKINLGIRHRLAPLMDGNRRKIELMNSLLFSLPGTPVIYYGDEIGMGDNFYLGDRDGVRTPMQWSSDRNAGFSEANPHTLYLPLILDPEYHYEAVNVELQQRNTSSLFWYMKRIINMRKSFKAFSRGDMKFLQVENPKVLAFTRSYEDETLLVIVNLSKHSQPAEVNLETFKGYLPVEVFSKNRFPAVKEGSSYFFTLGPHSYQWFRLEKTASAVEKARQLTNLTLEKRDDMVSPRFRQSLERDVLPNYLPSRPWFAGKNRTVYSIAISETIPIPAGADSLLFLLIDVTYESGMPETYQLPVTFVHQSTASQLQQTCPESIIAQLKLGEEQGMLCDAFYLKSVQQMLFRYLAKDESLLVGGGTIAFNCKDVKMDAEAMINSRMQEGSEHTTSIAYNNAYFLKMYRKVEAFINPDVELTRFLSEEAGFKNTPAFKGTIVWTTAKGITVLGMMQELVENHGNGYDFMQERVGNFIERVLARKTDSLKELQQHLGTLSNPVGFDELPTSLQELIGGRVAEQARLLGKRTGELHKALAEKANEKEFVPEEFSLHYQRSLFSSMQSLVREVFHNLERKAEKLPEEVQAECPAITGEREILLRLFKRIYEKKLDILKIRNHGNLGLKNVLLTSTDMYINDFGGNAVKAFSERRLKRSPLRDIAQMICDIYYVTYEGFYFSNHIPPAGLKQYLPYAEQWAFYISSFFLKAYGETVEGKSLLPEDSQERETVLQVFLLERALKHLNLDLLATSYRAMVPLRIVAAVLKGKEAFAGRA